MAHTYITCPNGHGGPGVLDSLGWEGEMNTCRCRECNSVFDVDHSGDEPTEAYSTADSTASDSGGDSE